MNSIKPSNYSGAEPTFVRLNPLTGEVASSAQAMSPADAVAIADKAHAAFASWSQTGPNLRRQLLLKAADSLLARKDDLIRLMQNEIGATSSWAGFNVVLAASMAREAASLTTQIVGETIPSDKPGCLAMTVREPVGVCLGIAPWNAPVILGVRAIATALACGNTVVLKASEKCPATHQLLVECFQSAGFPADVINVVTNAPEDGPDVVNILIDHPAVLRINFTGSTPVGKAVAKRAAEHLKPVLLELGGKAPLLVLDDANLDEAVAAAAFGAFFNQGQICMSTERIIVVEEIAEAFLTKFREKVATLVAGDPVVGKAPLGAMIGQEAIDKVQALIADAVSKGAEKVVGGHSEGVLMSATVIDKVTKDMNLYGEESFGPVVAILRAKNEDHAVELANDSEFGLSASIFTRDAARGLRLSRRIRSGICHINGPTVHDEAQMPFGGVKSSGYGKFGGKSGVAEFTELRWITIETQPGHYPI
ncbi:aldehyde dehydrogenase (plasmid) [Agrobacterium tumefaciens]|uniref:Aldehyde dehydrogenase n=1 Tax=Agrobacterium tumefaciens TaxID=358 RepID=A0AAP9J9R9_AGRTU|nr:aldehyde dehydrogenase [Agrobacterium tumefaciens]NSZ60066.1 aldehyde dehydrogenase [Agrobacterium tumefaciens]QDY97666.1 aldehyde dehydrogenase [Agrobacterium tumefaciens]UXS12789.1 aldehyde dehydrogenase [Agrobacterium tumefaciens]UXS20150.1 aldehyde dehydrogenase [Agrobacterium tumefaciens]UXS27798.1 aldehyde dehydrogenase [Agrobacterium tumefaciens]